MRHFTLDQSRNLKCKTPKRIYGAFANGISLSCLLSLLREKRWGPKDPVVTGELDWSQFLHQKNRQRRICFTVGWQPGWFLLTIYSLWSAWKVPTSDFQQAIEHMILSTCELKQATSQALTDALPFVHWSEVEWQLTQTSLGHYQNISSVQERQISIARTSK